MGAAGVRVQRPAERHPRDAVEGGAAGFLAVLGPHASSIEHTFVCGRSATALRSGYALALLAVGAALLAAPAAWAARSRRSGVPLGGGARRAAGIRASGPRSARAGAPRHDGVSSRLPAPGRAGAEERVAPGGSRWYRLSLPGRPNGQRGWVPADAVQVRRARPPDRRAPRRAPARGASASDGKVVLRAAVAVGMPGAPTPLGRNFYVQSRWAPTDSFYGPFALETAPTHA